LRISSLADLPLWDHDPADAGRGEPRFPLWQGAGGGLTAGAGPVSPGFGRGLQRCAPDASRPGWVIPLRSSAPWPPPPPALAGRRLGCVRNRSAHHEGCPLGLVSHRDVHGHCRQAGAGPWRGPSGDPTSANADCSHHVGSGEAPSPNGGAYELIQSKPCPICPKGGGLTMTPSQAAFAALRPDPFERTARINLSQRAIAARFSGM
jgi:hypothetical protein